MGDLYRIKGIFNKEGYQSYQSSGCCIVGARLLLWQDRALDPNYLKKKQVASILIERAAHLWEALWGLNTLKIENTSSATPQPASTYDINWKNRRWFSGKLNDWLWPWGQCHWDSDYLEISSRYTNLKILRCLIHELSHSQPWVTTLPA